MIFLGYCTIHTCCILVCMEDREAYTLSEAARILDTTEGALRQRVRRGTLESYKEEGRVYVYIHRTDTVQGNVHTPESQALMSEIQARFKPV
jgi:hypothetical protein